MTELRNSDNQLYEALTLLRGINLLTPQSAADNESMAEAEASEAQTDERWRGLEPHRDALASHEGFGLTHGVFTEVKDTGRQHGIRSAQRDTVCKML